MINEKFKQDGNMALKDVIKEARLKVRLKQEEVAKLIGVTVQTYSKWENGKTEPKASQVWSLSEILGVSTEEICRGELYEEMDDWEFIEKLSKLEHRIDKINFYSAIEQSVKSKAELIEFLEEIYEPQDAGK